FSTHAAWRSPPVAADVRCGCRTTYQKGVRARRACDPSRGYGPEGPKSQWCSTLYSGTGAQRRPATWADDYRHAFERHQRCDDRVGVFISQINTDRRSCEKNTSCCHWRWRTGHPADMRPCPPDSDCRFPDRWQLKGYGFRGDDLSRRRGTRRRLPAAEWFLSSR